MIEIIAMVALFLIGMMAGVRVQRIRSIDYKQRWQESIRLMQELRESGEIEKKIIKQVVKVKELPTSEADEKIRAKIAKMPFYTREVMERDRLKAGQHPVDDLEGLPNFAYESMVRYRRSHGYDELGQKFK